MTYFSGSTHVGGRGPTVSFGDGSSYQNHQYYPAGTSPSSQNGYGYEINPFTGQLVPIVPGRVWVQENPQFTSTSDPITGSTLDFIDRKDPIDLSIGRLYTAVYGRVPDEAGFNFWRGAIRDPLIDYNTIADEFFYSTEYRERTDGQTTGAIITGLYENVLGRGPDQDGLNFWLEELAMGNISMNGLLPAFANSDENIERFNSLLG